MEKVNSCMRKEYYFLAVLLLGFVFSFSSVSAGELEECQMDQYSIQFPIWNDSVHTFRFHLLNFQDFTKDYTFYYYPGGSWLDKATVCNNSGVYYGAYYCVGGGGVWSGEFDLAASCSALSANYTVISYEDAYQLSAITLPIPPGGGGWNMTSVFCQFAWGATSPYNVDYMLVMEGFNLNTFYTEEEIRNPTLRGIAEASFELIDINLSVWRILFLIFEIAVLVGVCIVLPISMLIWLRENLDRLLRKRG